MKVVQKPRACITENADTDEQGLFYSSTEMSDERDLFYSITKMNDEQGLFRSTIEISDERGPILLYYRNRVKSKVHLLSK